MRRIGKIGMRATMATQALRVYFLRRVLCRIENLRSIATAIDVRFACSVAALTGHAVAAVHLDHFAVWVLSELFANFFVAGGTGLGANKVARYC